MRRLDKVVTLAVISFGIAGTAAHADTLADWTFESSQPVSAGPVAPETGAGSMSGSHANAAAVYSTPAGNGSAHSFSSNNWTAGDYYQFSVSTTGFDDISLSFDQTSSATGPRDFELQYSTNGTTYTNFASYQVLGNGTSPNAAWTSSSSGNNPVYTFTEDLSGLTALNNQGTVFFRLEDLDANAVNGQPVGTAGTDRIDNVVVSGAFAPVPLPASVFLLGGGLIGLVGVSRRRRA